jgi:hypothetical protein
MCLPFEKNSPFEENMTGHFIRMPCFAQSDEGFVRLDGRFIMRACHAG